MDKEVYQTASAKYIDEEVAEIYNINMNGDYVRDEHRILCHLVWTTKRRKGVLTDLIAADCKTLIEQNCAENGWTVIESAMQPDHVHLLVQAWPTNAAAEIIQRYIAAQKG